MEAAVLAFSKALAASAGQERGEEPEDVAAALREPALSRWEWSALVVQSLVGEVKVGFEVVEEALRKMEVRLRGLGGS